MDNAIDRFAFRFRAYIYRSIRLCLADSQGVPATILLCCAIDLLAKYYSGSTTHTDNRKRYVEFLKKYFQASYDASSFYTFVRCGLLHGFTLENTYIVLCKDEPWAKDAHMKTDAKTGKIVINPFVLLSDTDKAFKALLADIRRDMSTQKRFFRVHKKWPLIQQQASWRKMKHLKSPNQAL